MVEVVEGPLQRMTLTRLMGRDQLVPAKPRGSLKNQLPLPLDCFLEAEEGLVQRWVELDASLESPNDHNRGCLILEEGKGEEVAFSLPLYHSQFLS